MQQATASAKIRLLSSDTSDLSWSDISKEIYQISTFRLGISEPLSPEENRELKRFLKLKYQDFNVEEIRTAFDLFCSKELDIDYDKKGHFNKLSNEFLGLVLEAYRSWRSENMKKYKPVPVEIKQIDTVSYWEEHFFPAYDKMKQDPNYYPFTQQEGWLIYDDLWVLIEKCFTDKEIKEFRAESARLNPKETGLSRILTLESLEDYKKRLLRFAKHLATKKWLEMMAFENEDIREKVLTLIKK